MITIYIILKNDICKKTVEEKLKKMFPDCDIKINISENRKELVGSYYSRYCERIKEKNKKYYAERHKRKYCYSYDIISPEGEKKSFTDFKSVVNFLGYSETYIHQRIRQGKDICGYKVEKVY